MLITASFRITKTKKPHQNKNKTNKKNWKPLRFPSAEGRTTCSNAALYNGILFSGKSQTWQFTQLRGWTLNTSG